MADQRESNETTSEKKDTEKSCSKSEDSSLVGYVHKLSPIKTSKDTKTKYFDCKMQTAKEKVVRVVCYSPEKRMMLLEAFEKKSAVEVAGTKRTKPNSFSSSEEYCIPKPAKIKQAKVVFPIDESLGQRLLSVKDCLVANVYETVDVKVKIMTKSENKQQVIINQQRKYKVECCVADETESVKLVLWEDSIDKVHCGKSYHIKNLTIRMFDDKKYLNTNELTVISRIDPIKKINLKSPGIINNVITGQCLGVDIKKQSACIACNASLENALVDDDTVTCLQCNISTLKSTTKAKFVCQLVLKEDGKLASYTTFSDGIASFLKSINEKTPIDEIEPKELKRLLLNAGPKQMVVEKSQKVISQFL